MSGFTCPPDAASCVVRQSNSSAFCQQCNSFCTTCKTHTAPPPRTVASPPPSPPPLPPTRLSSPPTPSSSPPSSPSPSDASSPSGLSVGAIIAIVAATVLMLLLVLASAWWFAARTRASNRAALSGLQNAPTPCRQYSLAVVARATGNWSKECLLGSGAYGDVYCGVCPEDGTTLWAVKRAKVITADFHREVGEVGGMGWAGAGSKLQGGVEFWQWRSRIECYVISFT
ncbi:unnamed protein product [Closterium sp. NIES-54]